MTTRNQSARSSERARTQSPAARGGGRGRFRGLLAAAVAAGLFACAPTAEPAPEVETAVDAPQRFALLAVETPSGRATGEMAPEMNARVHFAAFHGMTLETVAAALDIWRPTALDACAIVDPPPRVAANAALDLLSAGVVGLEGNNAQLTLSPRLFGAGPRLSGFTYAPDAQADVVTWAADAGYELWASGDEVEPFRFTFQPTDLVRIDAISGAPVGSATELEVRPGQDVVVSVETHAVEVFVSVRTIEQLNGPVAECRFGAIDGVAFDARELDRTFGAGADLEITVRTADAHPLPEGLGLPGELVVSSVDRVVVRR